jgi:hypothetical protein
VRTESVVVGTVASGRGNATKHLSKSAHELRQIVGRDVFPGSLNVLLKAPLRLDESAAHRFDDGARLLWPASLYGTDVWLYRWRHAPLHVLEVVSTVRLRDVLRLADGELVTIKIGHERIGDVSWTNRIVWSAFWLGRRQWCYSNDRYYYRTARWCRRFGATQAQPVGVRT